jgi:hypothetical protein
MRPDRKGQQPGPIVLRDSNPLPGTWREMLDHVSLLPDPPLSIVTSRLADERSWAEALNLGAYDALAKPFDAVEVGRILSLVSQHWQNRHVLHSRRTERGRLLSEYSPRTEGTWKELLLQTTN